MLEHAKVRGALDPIVGLFSWKDGSNVYDSELTREQASIFPKSIYMFVELESMIADFKGFAECLVNHPEYKKIVGRFFPLFWDGSNSWLATDLDPAYHNRVVLLHTEFEQMAFAAYDSFDNFLNDAIRANEENEGLTCFDVLKPL